MRGQTPGLVAPLAPAPESAVHEGSIAYAVVRAVARVPGVRRAMGAVPPGGGPASDTAASDDPGAVIGTPLYRRLEALRGTGLYRRAWAGILRQRLRGDLAVRIAPSSTPGAAASVAPERPAAPAGLTPWASRRVDDAIEVLSSVPFEEIQRRGWHFQPNHFYWPLNDVAFLRENPQLWHDRGLPKGIRWDLDGQVDVARRVNEFVGELADVPNDPRADRTEYVWGNGAFSAADAVVYYGLVRSLRPRRVVEVGSGWSSLLLARAIARNGTACDVTLIEPFPNEDIFGSLPADWQIERAIIQHADLTVFDRLGPGDICFYDGSHCVRTSGDVNWLLFEVLPRLSPGVFVHLHDIFFPDDYHDDWIFNEGLSWNEQYILQAFLMHNVSYRVHIANHMLWSERRQDLEQLYNTDGGSIWLEKVR